MAATTTTSKRQILIIDKSGTVKETFAPLHSSSIRTNELYKKAGFKSPDGFQEQFTWDIKWEDEKYTITLYAKKTGRIQKNAYGFPPPLEESIFYGNCILICQERDLTIKTWDNLFESIYEKYDENEDLDEEEDTILQEEDDEEESLEENEEDEMEEQEEIKPQITISSTRKKSGKIAKKKEEQFLNIITEISENFLDCSSELEMEPYI
jgi:hypothetical protein